MITIGSVCLLRLSLSVMQLTYYVSPTTVCLLLLVSNVQEAVLCFCRVCLCLGGVQYAGHKALNDLQHLVHRDIQADNFTW